jgi:peptidoglycan/xylan/chitin deacetylase (PgdA/CDA1 family)
MNNKLLQSINFSFQQSCQKLAEHWPWQLKVLLYHGVYNDNESPKPPDTVDPSVFKPLSKLRGDLLALKAKGYIFISPDEATLVLHKKGKFALLTFDDGYANNLMVLPLLRELQIPAVFFVCSWHIKNQKPFWWDVLHRELHAKGVANCEIGKRRRAMKKLKWRALLSELECEFGPASCVPKCFDDRPMTVEELKSLASDPLVSIGNHTHHHSILLFMEESEIVYELEKCQESITSMCGKTPSLLAYPNGAVNNLVVDVCRRLGFLAAFTTVKQPAYLGLRLKQYNPHLLPRLDY